MKFKAPEQRSGSGAFLPVGVEVFHRLWHNWGENTTCDLDPTKRYYIFNCDKNRFGNKLKIVFEVDLDLNIWIEKGILVKK